MDAGNNWSALFLDMVRKRPVWLRLVANGACLSPSQPCRYKSLARSGDYCYHQTKPSQKKPDSPHYQQIVLSHYSMSTGDLGPVESFPHRQMRTTTDVICDPSIEFIHGGLHLQVTHHLFPRLPRHNLRRASVLVKEFAEEQGLTYAEFGFVDGNREVLGTLKIVADQIKIMGKVAKDEVKEALDKKMAATDAKKELANGNGAHLANSNGLRKKAT